jgi:predicted naringenin-chalcone synthase
MQAVRALEPDGVTHLILASRTGFSAPRLDFQIMRAASLSDSVQAKALSSDSWAASQQSTL